MKLWKFLTTDIRELNLKRVEEVTKTGTDTAKAVFDLAKAVNEQSSKVETLKQYVGEISSLLDVLNSPIAQIAKDTIPFAPLAINILKLIAEETKKEPTLEQCMMLVSQAAYLESLRSLLRPYLQQLEHKEQAKASYAIACQLQELGDKEFIPQDAREALLSFPTSRLAQEFNSVLRARLKETGVSQSQTDNLTNRVTWNTPRFIHTAIANNADTLKPLAKLYDNGGREILERYQSIDKYLNIQIRTLPDQVVFQEETSDPDVFMVTYREIYVPLKAQPLDCDGREMGGVGLIELDSWISKTLENPLKSKHLMFIQGEAGRGKSVFCRMFADRVGKFLYPSYIPILIRLRGLKNLANRLQDTLESSPELQNCDFVTSDSGWLTDPNTRFLFLLDGFDELLLEERATGGLQEFLQQIEQFQQNSQHRFVITGRSLALLQVEKLISQTRNIVRIELQPMDNRQMTTWAEKWAAKAGNEETRNFWQFLKACPKDVQALAREPLLMYLLARMHREQRLSIKMFAEAKGIRAKIRIYDAAIKWVLEKQRHNENNRLTGLEAVELRQFLTEAATCVVHSGNEVAKVAMLEARLKASHNPAAKLLEKSRQETSLSSNKALNNLLASFYLKPSSGEQGGCIEFVHKSFGEFLFAERLLETLEDWSKSGGRRSEKFMIDDAKMHQELYDLLGYGGLTPEIISYLTPRLLEKPITESLTSLFQRLSDFYERWCENEFTDAAAPNPPQRTMNLLKELGSKTTGQRQVDVYTGLNVLILLLELHRYAQMQEELKDVIRFQIDEKISEEANKYEQKARLLKIIHYSDSIAISTFSYVVGGFLYKSNLEGTNLTGTNLTGSNFSEANLEGANLTGTNLTGSNFSEANLEGANLTGTNLTRSNFSGANLEGANLTNANLYRTRFIGTNLREANFENADLSETNLNGTNLSNANLENANLNEAYLIEANLSNANLISVNLYNANLAKTSLESANLISSYFIRANLSNANLENANLYNANLENANLENANLTSTDLENASLINANLVGADLTNANLTDANLKNIIWNKDTKTKGLRGLGKAKNVPETFKQQVDMN